MDKRVPARWLHLGLAMAFTVVYIANLYGESGLRVTMIVGGAMIGGLVCWLLTTWRRPADPRRILPIYLLTLGLFFVHLIDELLFGFSGRIAALFAVHWTERDFVLTLMLYGPMLWLGAAVGLRYRNGFSNFIVWFILFGMLIGEPAHLLFPVLEGGRYHYFPGLATALLPLVAGVYGIVVIVSEHRAAMRVLRADRAEGAES
jgi:uncharacterized membrane protein YvlD (DUF360 family)